MPAKIRTEVVRGRSTPERDAQILTFWAAHGALVGEAARQRLDQVVCILADAGDDVIGVSSAYPDRVALVGGRLFWVYRRFLAPGLPTEPEDMLLNTTFEVLEAEDGAAGGDGAPVGLCALVEDRDTMRQRPEVIWTSTGLTYAGYLEDGTQVRARYFDGARIV